MPAPVFLKRSSRALSARVRRACAGMYTRAAVRVQGHARVAVLAIVGIGLLTGMVYNFTRPAQTAAATSNVINFQARLETAAGAIVPDGNYNIEFKLYNGASGGSALWTEDYLNSASHGVEVSNGYVTVNLGSVTSFPGTINWDQQLWLTMNIGGTGGSASWDGEMNPRLQLTALPYAFQSNSAHQLQQIQGSYTGTLSFGSLTANRSISLPDEGGTLCIQSSTNCGFALSSGSGNYIQNQNASPQTADFNITGIGTAGTLNATTALQTDGTTRIDSSGNLQNIGTISASGAITDSADGGKTTLALTSTGSNTGITLGGDTTLYRSAASALKTDGALTVGQDLTVEGNQLAFGTGTTLVASSATNPNSLQLHGGYFFVVGSTTTDSAYCSAINTDPNCRLQIRTDGLLEWGPGTSAVDTNLYRSAASTLKTDDSLTVGTDLSVTGASTLGGLTTLNTLGTADTSSLLCLNSSKEVASCSSGTGAAFVQGGNSFNVTGVLGTSDNYGLNIQTDGVTAISLDTNQNATFAGNVTVGSVLSVNTASNTVQIGSSTANTNGINLVLNNYSSATDPSGTEGSMYYNTSMKQFRCYQNGGWVNCAGEGGNGVNTVGILDGQTKSADGAVISGSNIYLQTADQTHPGLVSTGVQVFGGAKTFAADSTAALQVQNAAGTTTVLAVDTTGNNVNLGASTKLVWGGNANLYQSATNMLQTDDSLTIGTDLAVTGTTTLSSLSVTSTSTFTGQIAANGGIATNNANVTTGTGTINTAAISGGTLSGGSFTGGSVSSGSLTNSTVNGLGLTSTAITAPGAFSLSAGGTNQNLSLQGSGTGSVIVQSATNASTAFQVQTAGATPSTIFDVDTANGRVGVGTAVPGYTLDVQGGTGIVGQFSGRVIGANAVNTNELTTLGQVNGLITAAAGNYILNQTTLQASSNFHISGTGTADTSLSTPLVTSSGALAVTGGTTLSLQSTGTNAVSLDSGTTGAVNIGTGANAKAVTVGNTTGATSVALQAGSGGVNVKATAASALQVQDTAGTNYFTLDTVVGTGNGTFNLGNTASQAYIKSSRGSVAGMPYWTLQLGDNQGSTLLLDGADSNSNWTTTNGGIALSAQGGALALQGISASLDSLTTGAVNVGTRANAKTVTVGNTTGATSVVLQSGTGGINLSPSGASNTGVTVKPGTDSTAAFQIQNAGGTSTVLDVDTTNSRVGIGTAAPAYALDVQGGTGIVGQFSGRVIGANAVNTNEFTTLGQVNSLISGSGGNYILNQTSVQASSNFHISGTGTADTSFSTPLVTSSATLSVTAGTSLTLQSTTINAVTLDSGTTGAVNVGTGANAKAVTVGNTTAGTTIVLQAPTTSINQLTGTNTVNLGSAVGSSATQTINIGTSVATGSITTTTIGSLIGTSTTTLQGGSSGINLMPSGASNTGVLVKPINSSTAAFQVQNTSGYAAFGVDTTNGQAILGSSNNVNGTLAFQNSAGSNTVSLTLSGNPSNSYTLLLPTTVPSPGLCLATSAANGSQLVFSSCTQVSGAVISYVNEWDAHGSNISTLSDSPTSKGNLLLLTIAENANGQQVTSISGGGVSSWSKVTYAYNGLTGSNQRGVEMWRGVVTSTGSSTITVSGSTNATELSATEYSIGSSAASWSVDVAGNNYTSLSTTITYPSLTPQESNELYTGYGWSASSPATGGGTAGFTYKGTGGGNMWAYDTSINGGTPTQPTANQPSSTQSLTVGAFIVGFGASTSILNSTASQPANLNVQAATSGSVAGVFQANTTGSGDILDLKDGSGNNVVTVGSTGDTLLRNYAGSTTAFQVQNASGAQEVTVDTTNPNYALLQIGGSNTGPVNSQINLSYQGTATQWGIGTDAGSSQNYGAGGFYIHNGPNNLSAFGLTTTGQAFFQNSTNSTTAFQVLNSNATPTAVVSVDTTGNGKLVVGTGSPTATPSLLVLGNNSSATNPTEVDGGMFYSSNSSAFMCGTAGSWLPCSGSLYSNTAASSAVNTCTTTCAAFSTAIPVPANYCQAGRTISIKARGYWSATTSYINFTPYYGTSATSARTGDVTLGPGQNSGSVTVGNVPWQVNIDITCYSATTMIAQTQEIIQEAAFSLAGNPGTAAKEYITSNTNASTVVSNTAKNIYLFPGFQTSAAGNTATVVQMSAVGN